MAIGFKMQQWETNYLLNLTIANKYRINFNLGTFEKAKLKSGSFNKPSQSQSR